MDEIIYRLKIKGFENYGITKDAQIYSFLSNRFLRLDFSRGYASIALESRIAGKPIRWQVHRLMAILFLDNPNQYPIVNHKDGNKLNNSIDNLEWCTYSYNTKHAVMNNLLPSGFNSPVSKLKKEDIFNIYKDYETIKNIRTLSKKYNVSDTLVHSIVKGARWTECYREYYKKEPLYTKKKRRFITKELLKSILYDYYVNCLDTVLLESKYGFDNSHIGALVRGKRRVEEVKECLLEIKEALDNQQPSLVEKQERFND